MAGPLEVHLVQAGSEIILYIYGIYDIYIYICMGIYLRLDTLDILYTCIYLVRWVKIKYLSSANTMHL